MLSDKEKEAIDLLKNIDKQKCMMLECPVVKNNIERQLKIIELNRTIRKQSKEIEELKEQCKEVVCIPEGTCFMLEPKDVDKKWENKIKEILGIEEDIDNEKLLSLLQTIVDENARLEEIEDRKVQIEYNNVFNKGVKSVENKIKAKIEELENYYRELYKQDNSPNEFLIGQDCLSKLSILQKVKQSLLEKE